MIARCVTCTVVRNAYKSLTAKP